jgi:hypothetical protein
LQGEEFSFPKRPENMPTLTETAGQVRQEAAGLAALSPFAVVYLCDQCLTVPKGSKSEFAGVVQW